MTPGGNPQVTHEMHCIFYPQINPQRHTLLHIKIYREQVHA
jgi:hypothetical protein